VNKRG